MIFSNVKPDGPLLPAEAAAATAAQKPIVQTTHPMYFINYLTVVFASQVNLRVEQREEFATSPAIHQPANSHSVSELA